MQGSGPARRHGSARGGLIPADEIKWTQKYREPTRQVDTLLCLGCNILMTAHLAQEVVDVFERLAVDFEAVGGVEFCCGTVHHREGDVGSASRISHSTVDKFESYGARQVVKVSILQPSIGRGDPQGAAGELLHQPVARQRRDVG